MSEVRTGSQPQAQSPGPPPSPPYTPLRLGRILLVILPLGIVALAGAIAWGYFDVGTRLSEWMTPPLVPVSGRVFLNGEPLVGGQVFARSLDRDGCNALGKTDAQGNFTLRTDVRGDFLPGVLVGQHRVIIIKPDPAVPPGPFKPPTITPPECADFDHSPLRMKVERDPARNNVEFRLEYRKKSP